MEIWLMTARGFFLLQFLIQIIEIWTMNAKGNLLYNSLSKSLKYDLGLLGASSFTIAYQCNSYFGIMLSIVLYRKIKNLRKTPWEYDLWLPWAISFTTPYQNHWNVTCESYGPFQLQFLIKIIEIWHMAAMGHFHYNSLSKSLKYDLWLLWASPET